MSYKFSATEPQIDLEECIANVKRFPTDPLPGTEQPFTYEQSVQSQYLDCHGREIPNPLPMSPPVGYVKSLSIAEQMRQMIRLASHEAAQAGAETEAEANDFDVDEDMEPSSPWEHDFDIDPTLEAMIALHSRPAVPPSPAQPATPSSPTPVDKQPT